MNMILKLCLSMSFSGALLILVLLLGKQFLKNKISRQWQYYIWLIVILRLLLPFGAEPNLMGKIYQAASQSITQTILPPEQQKPLYTLADVPVSSLKQNNEKTDIPSESFGKHLLQDIVPLLVNYSWLIWLVVALSMLIRKITIYQSFIWYIHAGLTPVSDTGILDQFSIIMKQVGIKKPIELYTNPLISSPLLIGFFHPYIILPNTDFSENDFSYIILHELTHYKRLDMFYKWLVQITVCLHWFNPLVYLMNLEITKACEFSCDEAVLAKMGYDKAQDYGKTLLNAMATVGKYKENLGSVNLNENKQLLKERLGAIMNFQKKSKTIWFFTGILTLCIIFGASFLGIYPVATASNQATSFLSEPNEKELFPTQLETKAYNEVSSLQQAKQYYEAGNLYLFQIAFSRLDESTQREWLEKLYINDDFAFFSVAVRGLNADTILISDFAKKAYTDKQIAFFSTLADCMSEELLAGWLDITLNDKEFIFQSILSNKLKKDNDLLDTMEKENEKQQLAEYQAVGVTKTGKNYYYQGQLVNIFLDIRPNKSFYTLDINPAGTISIKIIRGKDGQITGITYMAEAEVTELLNDMADPDDPYESNTPQIIPINLETITNGEIIWLGEYTLSDGDRIWYNVLAETGTGLQVGFAKPEDEFLNTTYYSVKNLRQKDSTLECIADFTFSAPVKPGTYKLFLRATDGTLHGVKGNISITLTNPS